MIDASGLLSPVNDFIKASLLRPNAKRCSVWLYGQANCGKTTFINMINAIFVCGKLEPSSSTNWMVPVESKEVAHQILLLDDVALPRFFSKGNISHAKRVMEGNGWVGEEKYANS